MPFCRKCGRRLVEYSESCPDCGTSTTSPIIKIKKVNNNKQSTTLAAKKNPALKKVAKASIPIISTISVKEVTPIKLTTHPRPSAALAKVAPTKTEPTPKPTPPPTPTAPPRLVTPAPIYDHTEIKKSEVSLKEDYFANPHDYETQAFDFDLVCEHNHFWEEGKQLPISKGRAFCPKCGEKLRKPQRRQRNQRYRRMFA
jgi:rRNA maturation protein Nop10